MKKIACVLCLVLLLVGCGKSETESPVSDLDLTVMSSQMVYGAVFDIMSNPEAHLGQSMKVGGVYVPSYYDTTDQNYHYVVIADALSCCQQGIEFIWNGVHVYPDDYPKEGDAIVITGVFGKYEELGEIYYYILADEIVYI